MSDKRQAHERYRGGGRERRDRRNRQDRFSPAERRPAGDRRRSGATDRNRRGGTNHRTRPTRRYGSAGRGSSSTDAEHGQVPARDRLTERHDEYPGLGHGHLADREGQGVPEIVAGNPRSSRERRLPASLFPRSDRRRRTDDRTWAGERSSGTGDRYRQRYGEPVGRQSSGCETREDWRFRTGERDAHHGSGESNDGDGGRDQPRDPETGRFLSKDEADREE